MHQCNRARLEDKINTMKKFGDTGQGGITRYTLSDEDLSLRAEFIRQMEAIGCEIKIDDFANIYAILSGSDPSLPAIAMGSHSDSVRDGGNYDGILGVIAAMEVLESVISQNISHKHNLIAMIWTNEEGSLYPPVMMSSGVICYEYLPDEVAKNFSEDVVLSSISVLDPTKTFGMALEASGLKGKKENRLSAKNAAAMLELHIEQGPILESTKKDIGIVTCVAGISTYRIHVSGQSDHAGTTPMSFRKDALYGAVQALTYLHESLDTLDSTLVYTTGQISCHPNVMNVIPDEIVISLELRHVNPKVLEQAHHLIKAMPTRLANCSIEVIDSWTRETVYFNSELLECLKNVADELGYSNQEIHSGAGHDAQFCSYMIPTAMIFVPSKDGRSHCEIEYTPIEQCEKGVNVLLNSVLAYDQNH